MSPERCLQHLPQTEYFLFGCDVLNRMNGYVHSNVFSEHIDTNSYRGCVMILPFAVYIADQVNNESIKIVGTKEKKTQKI